MANDFLKVLGEEIVQETTPPCPVYEMCGGCKLQQLTPETQRSKKELFIQKVFEKSLGEGLVPEMYPAFFADPWHYRSRLRFSARNVHKKGSVLVGFRESKARYVTDMNACLIVPEKVSGLIPALRDLIPRLSIPGSIPQIDVADAPPKTALIIRHLESFTDTDLELLSQFEKEEKTLVYLQSKGLDTIHRLGEERKPLVDDLELSYELPDFGVTLHFHPTCFTQINTEINQLMVAEAIRLLNIKKGDRVADMFCGIGNFSLPLARQGAEVLGFELNPEQIDIAKKNAALNQLEAKTHFYPRDLEIWSENDWKEVLPIKKMILDPPRSGAEALVSTLPIDGPEMIVYISCNPVTLARDAKILVEEKGYVFRHYRMLDMFPHTYHMETLAFFEKP